MKRLLALLLFCSAAAALAQYPVTDSLKGSGVLTTPWSSATGGDITTTCSRSSLGLVPTVAGGICSSVYVDATITNDQYSQVTNTTTSDISNRVGPGVRCNTSGTGYLWEGYGDGNIIIELLNGSYNGNFGGGPSVSPGDIKRLTIVGSTITATNVTTGVSVSVTNSDITSGSPCVWQDQSGSTATTPTDFQADCAPGSCGTLTPPSFSPGSGTYGPAQDVTLTAPAGASICYTLDGTTPAVTVAGTCPTGTTTYTTPIHLAVGSNLTINAISTEVGQVTGVYVSASYVIQGNHTWYIRTDGGTPAQCSGWVNHALAGATGNDCALSHPFYLLTDNTNNTQWAWKIFGGDTVQFEDVGPYYIGKGPHNGLGQDWLYCDAQSSDKCEFPPLPSGTSAMNTKWLGLNTGSCHNTFPDGLKNPTVFEGINGVFSMFTLDGADYTDTECIEFTQPDTCTEAGNGQNAVAATALSGGVATYTWYSVHNNPPLITQSLAISGTTNDGGALNGSPLVVTSVNNSIWSITTSQATTTNTAVFGWTLVSGDVPRAGQAAPGISGTTNGGGQFNTPFGFYANNGGNITAVTGGPTSGTFTVTVTGGTPFTIVAQQSEAGSATQFTSGLVTTAGPSGTLATTADTGTIVPSGQCVLGTNDYAAHGISVAYLAGTQGPSNTTLKDIGVIGLAGQGLLGSHINKLSTDYFNASNIYVIGNGVAGWDSDGGGCSNNCESVGNMNLSFVDVEWNGCNAVKPYTTTLNGNGFNYCYDQGLSGYGDGFSFIAAGDVIFNVTNSRFAYNTQDGFDALHLTDDLTTNPSVNIYTSEAIGNEGQTFKLGAGLEGTAINNLSVQDCRVFLQASNFPLNPFGWNAGVIGANNGMGLTCRASGDAWSFQLKDYSTITLENNTSIGEGATQYDFECASGATCTTHTKIIFENNITKGYLDRGTGGVQAAGIYLSIVDQGDPNPFLNAGSILNDNMWATMKYGCPDPYDTAFETNPICPATPPGPGFVSDSDIDAPDLKLLSNSLAIGAGVYIPAITTDYSGATRPNPPSVGAYEYQGFVPGQLIISGAVKFMGHIKIQ